MSFLPLHRDKEHEYKNGSWFWDNQEPIAKLKFTTPIVKKKKPKLFRSFNAALIFSDQMNVADEKIFHEKFQRKSTFYDSDVITLQDIKNLSLFLLESKVSTKFIEFVHSETFDKFLYSFIFYFDFYLKVLEFLLIRRDQEADGRGRDMQSLKVEQFLSKQLSDRRLLIAREYSKILMMTNKEVSSDKFKTRPSTMKDLLFFEYLIDFVGHCVFIAMHRRAFNAIGE
jgi:protein phosphatase 1 regulatory subunit 36